jgi:ankyrin repeat protein
MFHHAGLKTRLDGMSGSKLHDAVRQGRHDLVQQLLAAGADVETKDKNGMTPLFYAADLDPSLATLEGHSKIVQMLLAAGANVHARERCRFRSVLHVAAKHGRRDMVQQLLAAGADVDVKDANNVAALIYAEEHSDVVQVLLAAGADVDVVSDGGVTPLYSAAWQGYIEVVQQLLAAGASVDPKRNAGRSPLFKAASAGELEVVQLLLQNGAHPRAGGDDAADRILAETADEGHVDVLQLLLEAWGEPTHPAAELAFAANVAAGWEEEQLAAFVRLVKELRRLYPLAELPQLDVDADPEFAAAAAAAALKEWASDVSKKDEQRAALCEREEAVAREQQLLQQLVVHVAGIAKEARRRPEASIAKVVGAFISRMKFWT